MIREMFKRRNYKIGFDIWGLILFLIIMIPNFIWFAVPARNDVLRNQSVTPVADMIASVFQVMMVAALCMIINKLCQKPMKKILFAGIVMLTILYLVSWGAYYAGITHSIVILDLCIAPCLALILFSIARKNAIALIAAGVFMLCHAWYGVVNFVVQ